MAEAAAYRGPDGRRHVSRNGAAFCHLSMDATIESTLEKQPLCTSDHSVCLVADVRLDNRSDLLRKLETTELLPIGRTAGDGEILLAAFLHWGEACVARLLGDFAFAIWNSRARTLFCARDPLGVRPLCFVRSGNLFAFATESQQILHYPASDCSLDELSIADYLAGKPQDSGRSFFRQVRRLPPGHLLIANETGERLVRFWAPEQIRIDKIRPGEAAERFREVLRQSVADRLRACGRTVGLALSGGLDSPSIAVLAQRQLQTSGASKQLLSYSFVFDRLTGCDERPYIQALVKEAGFDSALVSAENHCLLDDPGLYGTSFESPFEGWLSPHRQGLGLLAERSTRVLLTGQGADDLLQGTPLVLPERLLRGDARVVREAWFHAAARGRAPWRDLYRLLLGPVLPGVLDKGLRRLVRRSHPSQVPAWLDPLFARRTGIAERLAARRPHTLRGMAQGEIASHLEQAPYQQAVHWLDRMGASFSIEVRHPFLDRRLAEAVLATPPDQVFELGCYKPLLRQAMDGLLPDSLRLRRDKTRLGEFVDFSLRDKAGDFVEDLLGAPRIAELGFVNGPELRTAFRAYRQGDRHPEKRKIWLAVTLELWLRRHCGKLGFPINLKESGQPAAASSMY
jgi:asparagine synthase (glutamine-hydrolysing)